jgi:hypothetical protein
MARGKTFLLTGSLEIAGVLTITLVGANIPAPKLHGSQGDECSHNSLFVTRNSRMEVGKHAPLPWLSNGLHEE